MKAVAGRHQNYGKSTDTLEPGRTEDDEDDMTVPAGIAESFS